MVGVSADLNSFHHF